MTFLLPGLWREALTLAPRLIPLEFMFLYYRPFQSDFHDLWRLPHFVSVNAGDGDVGMQ